MIIFFISGLKLRTDEIKSTLTSYKQASLGFFLILVLTPLLGFAVVRVARTGSRPPWFTHEVLVAGGAPAGAK